VNIIYTFVCNMTGGKQNLYKQILTVCCILLYYDGLHL